MSEQKNNRRDFLKLSGLGLLGAAVGTRILAGGSTALAAQPLVDPKDSLAASLGYVHDAAKVDTKKFPKKAGKDGAKQHCYNCMFYQAKGDAKKSEQAACTIFAGKDVKGKGWCNTWTQNPAVKD